MSRTLLQENLEKQLRLRFRRQSRQSRWRRTNVA